MGQRPPCPDHPACEQAATRNGSLKGWQIGRPNRGNYPWQHHQDMTPGRRQNLLVRLEDGHQTAWLSTRGVRRLNTEPESRFHNAAETMTCSATSCRTGALYLTMPHVMVGASGETSAAL